NANPVAHENILRERRDRHVRAPCCLDDEIRVSCVKCKRDTELVASKATRIIAELGCGHRVGHLLPDAKILSFARMPFLRPTGDSGNKFEWDRVSKQEPVG